MAAWLVLKDGPQCAIFMRRLEEELKKSTEALRELEHAKGVIRKLSKRPFLKKIVEANKDELEKLVGSSLQIE